MKDTPAFPKTGSTWDSAQSGMTLRDYFAAKAMQGFMADSFLQAEVDEFAARAYDMADAMLKARVAK